ncbi:hypothetical protein O9929_17600 [Vibrio lentus]|nr:hypothetical protein [Vibrio lentus]
MASIKGNMHPSNEDVIQLREVGDEAMEIIHSGNRRLIPLLTSIDETAYLVQRSKSIQRKMVARDAIDSFN